MKPKILADFQICVSVPLSYFHRYSLASLRAAFVIQKKSNTNDFKIRVSKKFSNVLFNQNYNGSEKSMSFTFLE